MDYEKRNALGGGTNMQSDMQRPCNSAIAAGSLDQVLVKRISRLEKEKIEHEKMGYDLAKESCTMYLLD